MGRNQYWAGRVYDLYVLLYDGRPGRLSESDALGLGVWFVSLYSDSRDRYIQFHQNCITRKGDTVCMYYFYTRISFYKRYKIHMNFYLCVYNFVSFQTLFLYFIVFFHKQNMDSGNQSRVSMINIVILIQSQIILSTSTLGMQAHLAAALRLKSCQSCEHRAATIYPTFSEILHEVIMQFCLRSAAQSVACCKSCAANHKFDS